MSSVTVLVVIGKRIELVIILAAWNVSQQTVYTSGHHNRRMFF